MDEKPNKYEHLPIPTYEEATSSRPASSQSRIGPEEISDDAERQGLLGHASRNPAVSRRGNYEAPTVESERPSLDSLDGIDVESDDGEVRREMQQMELEEPDNDNGSHRSLLTYRFKRLTSFTSSLSSLHLPSFRRFLPSSLSIPSMPSIPWPKIDWASLESNRVVIIGRLFGIFLIGALVYVLIASNILTMGRGRMGAGSRFPPESVKNFVQGEFRDPTHIGRHLKRITQYPHIAGTEGNYVLGEYVAEIFKESDLEYVDVERFDVYLNYPRKDGRRVAIVEPEDQKWEAQIEEDREETMVFHGHSKSGDVTGPLIYANYGSREDFAELNRRGISVSGAVVLVRYGGTEPDRALKIKAAELAGAVGCIIYSDPAQEGYGHGPTLPTGRFLPADGVQRGAVSMMSWVLGDVLSPGWASTPGNKDRLRPEDSEGLVKIPSIPLSWRDAQHLLGAIKGHGDRLDGAWIGVPETEYWTGNQNSPKVNLKNLQDEETRQPIYNVLGRITGWEEPDKKIIVGNHRDSWCLGGADPGIGTAIMLHLVHTFKELRDVGWRPLRTIEFASWDGEEYNMIGSTEHVENRMEDLRRNGVLYLNVDSAVTGRDFQASISPILREPLLNAMGRITDPALNKTLLKIWEEKKKQPSVLGAGSDYVGFQYITGTSSLDMSFTGDRFPYHSCYEDYEWMERFGDPTWEYSAALGQLWALLILDFADNPLLPFDVRSYAAAMGKYLDDLELDTRKYLGEGNPLGADLMATPVNTLSFLPLRDAIYTLKERAHQVEQFDEQWISLVYGNGGFETSLVTVRRVDRNDRMANLESNLLDLSEGGGLVNRTQYKHVISAPKVWSGYEGETFPSLRQWMVLEDWVSMQQEIEKVAGILNHAARELVL